MLKIKHILGLWKNELPRQLVIQISDRCNALCPQCGMRRTSRFERSTLSREEIKKIITAAAHNGVEALSFTGGEPLMYLDELVYLIKYAGDAGIEYIRTGTNGFMFMGAGESGFTAKVGKLAAKLAATPLRNFWISLDSANPEVHESMRGFPKVVRGMAEALPIFHEHGIYPSANLGINRNVRGDGHGPKYKTGRAGTTNPSRDEDGIEAFYQYYRNAFKEFYWFILELGFTTVNTCYPMSIEDGQDLEAVYAATAVDDIVRFSPKEKALLFKALLDTIPEFRSQLRVFSPRCSLYALSRHYGDEKTAGYPCRGGLDYFFIDSQDGDTYPCGYRGRDNLGKFWNLNGNRVNPDNPCRQCDWECFRDPSELFGPLLEATSRPLSLVKRIKKDPGFFQFWLEDLRYYQACSLFDGRRPPDYRKMSRF